MTVTTAIKACQENHGPDLASSVNTPYLDKFIPANHLKKGEHLKTADGTLAVVDGGSTPKVHEGWMWDLTVPGNNDHDFYVIAESGDTGERADHVGAGGTPVLVHNQNLGCGEQYLYRAVKNDELSQIQSTRTFTNPRGIETKYFATTPEGAAAYAKAIYARLPGEGPYTIVRTTIKSDLLNAEDTLPYLSDAGGGIAGYAIPTETLPSLGRARILPFMPLP